MPPKSKGKKASADPIKQQGEDKLKRVEGEVIALQRQLQMLNSEHKEAREREQSWRKKVAHYEAILAKKEQDMDDITKSMARKSTVCCIRGAVGQESTAPSMGRCPPGIP